jgi:hypothetical protein
MAAWFGGRPFSEALQLANHHVKSVFFDRGFGREWMRSWMRLLVRLIVPSQISTYSGVADYRFRTEAVL